MGRELFIGLGLGFVLYPAVGYLERIPFVGSYMTLLIVVLGVILLIKGYAK
ncbi:MAG: hypothetical protein ABIA37_01680 [Candidatus Woesearchaeota archaeon]